MRKVSKIVCGIVAILCLFGCGHRKPPTGGPEDKVKPKIVSISPNEFQELDKEIEITFSKPMDRSTITTSIITYPPIMARKYNWLSSNTVVMTILEELKEDTNYLFNITDHVKGLHGNQLDKNYNFTFKNGKLQDKRISLKFLYEEDSDRNLPIQLKLFSEDSTFIYHKEITKNSIVLDNLNDEKHIIKAWIDKKKNSKYDYREEPYAEIFVDDSKSSYFDVKMAYQDTIKPKLKTALASFSNYFELTFTEPIKSSQGIIVSKDDSVKYYPRVLTYMIENEKVSVLTDTLPEGKYVIHAYRFLDRKNNETLIDSIYFSASSVYDSIPPEIVKTIPRDGASVKSLQPEFRIQFSEIIMSKDFDAWIELSGESRRIDYELVTYDSKEYIVKPKRMLKNYTSYKLVIGKETKDNLGNELGKDYEINFIPIIK